MISLAKRFGGNYAKYQFKDIKGNNPTLLKQKELAKIAARTNSRILIIGESGTGKELFAQAIHNYSKRKNEPFVAVSCAAIPRDLIESELFGYRGGAFTGARRDGQVGKFELANNGTLFLDEVNGLPLDLQSKLLRVLQQNEITRLGDTQTTPVDVRVIAASNLDLMTEVEKHNFREDFYYRLNVMEINVPPLRERMDDLALLINHIMERQSQEMNIKKPEISDDVFKILNAYRWPGNVRELENCIERALLLSQGHTILKAHFPERIHSKKSKDFEYSAVSLNSGLKDIIKASLHRCGGNVSMAARELKISRSTLYRKMKEFGFN
jgi:transcriptional regulator with PAS, ATPase and Fis domain